jgi:hypothetical protein
MLRTNVLESLTGLRVFIATLGGLDGECLSVVDDEVVDYADLKAEGRRDPVEELQ